MTEYYKLKYIITETFYETMLDENYTLGQASGRCFVEFFAELSENNIESFIVISTVLARIARHEPQKLKDFLKEYNKILELLKKFNLDDYLTKDEKEDILFDIGCIRTCIKKFVEKDILQ